jgi:cell division protein FtsB
MLALLKPLGYIAAAVLLCAYVFVLLRGPQGLNAMLEKRRQVREMEKSNAALREEIQRLRKRLDGIASRPDEQERIIRERTNKVKPGETIVILPDDPAGRP